MFEKADIGLFFSDFYDLSNKLKNTEKIETLRNNVLENRKKFVLIIMFQS